MIDSISGGLYVYIGDVCPHLECNSSSSKGDNSENGANTKMSEKKVPALLCWLSYVILLLLEMTLQ